jgi:hypothetical protein
MIVTLEIDADLPEGRIEAVQLSVQIDNVWHKPVLFAFGRSQKVREGKHLKLDKDKCTVMAVGVVDDDSE